MIINDNIMRSVYLADKSDYDYSKTTYEADGWGGGIYKKETTVPYAIMHSDRIYTDANNIRRFMLNKGVISPQNDYYCVAMSEGFETAAATLCCHNGDKTFSGYTYCIELIDKDGNNYYMNVIKTDSKGGDENDFTSMENLIEFITEFNEAASDNTYGVCGYASTGKNLNYDKLFNADNVRIRCVYAYNDGWMVSGSWVSGYTVRPDRDGIPIPVSVLSANLGNRKITQNGLYNAVDDDLDGYNQVTVNVTNPAIEAELRSKIVGKPFHENGTYYASEFGELGFDPVVIDVPTYKTQMEAAQRESERWKQMYEQAVGNGEHIVTEFNDPKTGKPYNFENAVYAGEDITPFLAALSMAGAATILDVSTGLQLSFREVVNGNRHDIEFTHTNLKNGMTELTLTDGYTYLNIKDNGYSVTDIGGMRDFNCSYIKYTSESTDYMTRLSWSNIEYSQPPRHTPKYYIIK